MGWSKLCMNTFLFQFGNGNPSIFTGLSPTFIVFNAIAIGATSAPGVTEVPTSTGLYYTQYTPLSPIAFVLDGTSSISGPQRYISGFFDPTVSSIIGTLNDSFGSTAADPTSIIGYLKRLQETNEGNNVFTKQSGNFQLWSRGITFAIGSSVYAGSSAMLINKLVSDSGSIITKS
jgi:hypothetical protein